MYLSVFLDFLLAEGISASHGFRFLGAFKKGEREIGEMKVWWPTFLGELPWHIWFLIPLLSLLVFSWSWTPAKSSLDTSESLFVPYAILILNPAEHQCVESGNWLLNLQIATGKLYLCCVMSWFCVARLDSVVVVKYFSKFCCNFCLLCFSFSILSHRPFLRAHLTHLNSCLCLLLFWSLYYAFLCGIRQLAT